MGDYTVNGKVAVIGMGQTTYYRHGQSPEPEFKLALQAILNAAEDAGLNVRDIDGFCSYSNDRNDPVRLGTAFNSKDIAFSNMFWGGGGGGVCGAVGNAAAALNAGYCKYVVVYRALAQGEFGRFGAGRAPGRASGRLAFTLPYGVMSAVHQIALRTRRFMYENDVTDEAFCAVSLASYAHAQNNPDAIMYGRPLTREQYYASRWIAEPFRLFDCCQENDGAAAIILTTTERAMDHPHKPVRLMAASQGTSARYDLVGHFNEDYGSANFRTVAPRLWEQAGISAKDVDVAQIYENFTGAVVMSMVEHGFCGYDEVMDFFTEENLTVGGRMPINTSGGNLAECYMHGLGLVIEAARQIRGTSVNQIKDAEISMVGGGPASSPVSSLVFCA
ncbi:MAG: acetyl-CoA acetyltransferase [Pseudomonadota bacterium]